MTVGTKIRKLRERRGVTQPELAHRLGISQPAGGAGAVAGGLSGFATGYVLGWLGCQIFG